MYRILIVDDEEIIRLGLKQAIEWEQIGFTIAGIAGSAFEALKFMEQNPIDVVLTDIRMPRMSGLELARCVTQRYPHIKIVILSGYSDFHYAQEAINYSVFAYLLKPSKEQDIINVFGKLKGVLDQERVQYERLKQNNDVLLERTLIDIITAEPEYQNEHGDTLVMLCPQLKGSYKYIMVIEIILENIEDSCTESTVLIRNCSEKIFYAVKKFTTKKRTCIPFSIIPGEIGILICCDEETGIERTAQSLFEVIQVSLIDYGKVNLVGGLSGLFTEIKDMSSSYYNAREILRHKVYKGINRVILNSDEFLDEEKTPNLSLKQIAAGIVKVVTSGCYEKGIDFIRSMFDEFKKSKITNVEWIYSTFYRLLFLIEMESAALGLNYERIFGPKEEVMQILKKLATFDDMSNYITKLIIIAVQKFQECEKDPVSKIIKAAVDKINCCYAQEINLESIARYLNISPTYLSRLFKKELNVNFKEYLTDVRITHAKELLKDIRFKVYEVAEQVGYIDQRYFSEIFKSKTGLTPLEYREKVREDDKN